MTAGLVIVVDFNAFNQLIHNNRCQYHILCECRQYCSNLEPLGLAGAILLDIAITVPSKAGISVTLKAVKEILYRFFGFGIVFFFGRCLCRRCLHKL